MPTGTADALATGEWSGGGGQYNGQTGLCNQPRPTDGFQMKMSSSARAREGNNSADRNLACREIKRKKKKAGSKGGLSVEASRVTQSGPKEWMINDLLPEQSEQQKGSESCFRKEQVLKKNPSLNCHYYISGNAQQEALG